MKQALSVRDLNIALRLPAGESPVVRDLDLQVSRGETVCLVGESGSGKTLTALALMRLLPRSAVWRASELVVDGVECSGSSDAQFSEMLGNRISMVFQNPMSSLNPVLTIGAQLVEGYLRHGLGEATKARHRAVELLERVGVPMPGERMRQFPHQLSGGLRQRVMIAMALMCEPAVIIGDEPTTALDVTVQAQTLRLLKELVQEMGVGLLLITHDLGVVSRVADKVVVMYAGREVESGPCASLFSDPLHPYTRGLIECAPDPARGGRFLTIPGEVPALRPDPRGCDFANRCPSASDACAAEPAIHAMEHRRWRCVMEAQASRAAPSPARGEVT